MKNYLNSIPFCATRAFMSLRMWYSWAGSPHRLWGMSSALGKLHRRIQVSVREKKQIRFHSSLLVVLLSSTVSSFEIWIESTVATKGWGLLTAVTNMSNPSANCHACPCGKGSILAMLAVCDVLHMHTVCSSWLWRDLYGNTGFIQLYLLFMESAAVWVWGQFFILCTEQTLILWSLPLYYNKYI